MLILESFQAGLSWECVLNKRESFRKAYNNFDLEKVCSYNEKKITLEEIKRIIEEVTPFMTGEFEVSDIKRARYAELFETPEESADRWFKVKLVFITLDEKSGAEKKTSQNVLVQAADLRGAVKRLDEGMKDSMMDYTIASVTETQIVDVYKYREAAPEFAKKSED